MRCSIVLATRNKAEYLKRTLRSIKRQDVPFEYEVIVVDDGSTDQTREVCKRAGVRYIKLENAIYRNPAAARNVGYRVATGKIIIAQSDEVIHHTPNTIELLCSRLKQGEFLLATVYNYIVKTQQRKAMYTGKRNKRPFFFLGSLWRKDLYAVGGNDEEFTKPGYDDDWFADCLIRGLGLRPRFTDAVVGHHQDHPRPQGLSHKVLPSKRLWEQKRKAGVFVATGGPWKLNETVAEWWERCHSIDYKRYLTGSLAEQVWEFLSIRHLIRKDVVALEVGVGLGYCTKTTAEQGVRLSALDISKIGLKRVEEWVVACYQQPDSLPNNTFDLVFSHLVSQHMSDEALIAQLREVLRALKPSGVFAMQFADTEKDFSEEENQSKANQKSGGIRRSLQRVRELVEAVGGRIARECDARLLKHGVVWRAVHIVQDGARTTI